MTHPRGIGSLQTPADLLKKLEHDLDRLREDPIDIYAAFDFFVTAHHLPDWCFPKTTHEADNHRFRNKHASVLLVCSHIANRAKHLVLTTKEDGAVVQKPGAILHRTGDFSRDFSDDFDIARLQIRDKAGIVVHDDVLDYATQVVAFWKAELSASRGPGARQDEIGPA